MELTEIIIAIEARLNIKNMSLSEVKTILNAEDFFSGLTFNQIVNRAVKRYKKLNKLPPTK